MTEIKSKSLILLPIYNAGDQIEGIIDKILKGIDELKEDYDVLAIDDGSKDNTSYKLKELVKQNSNLILVNNPINLGLAEVLKRGYRYSLEHNYARTIRIDADAEQDQTEVVAKLGKKILYSDVVIARRKIVLPKNSPEAHLKAGVAQIINGLFGLKVNEPSSGNLAFSKKPLAEIIDTDFLKNYHRRWSFDTSSILLAKKLGYNVEYVDVDGFYQKERRPIEKVLLQYSIYFSVINEIGSFK